MHSSHIVFYDNKLRLIEKIIRENLPLELLTVIPIELISLCCEYPMWTLLTQQKEKFHLVFPSHHYASGYINMFEKAIEHQRSVKISHYENIFIAAY